MMTQGGGELWGHPKGLYVLSMTELWERFSFYSMRGILTLYMVNGLAFSDGVSQKIYGAYLGFVYSAPLIGGMLADRLLGQRRAIIIGGLLMAIAQFSLAAHSAVTGAPLELAEGTAVRETSLFTGMDVLFFLGMGFLAIGNGFFKPNISTIVGTLYEQGDARRDGAFTIFYLGINIGALLASIPGQIAQKHGWHWGFLMAGIGMLLGQLVFSLGKGTYAGRGLPPREGLLKSSAALGIPNGLLLAVGIIGSIPAASYLLSQPAWVANISTYAGAIVLAYLLWEAFRSDRVERDRMIVIIVLCIFSMVFWGFFELAGSTIVLFTDKSIHLPTLPIMGQIESSFINSFINPAFILLMGLPFAKLWVWLDKHRSDPSSAVKFALGLAQVGLGFLVLFLAAIRAGEGKSSVLYLVLAYFLHTTGELCLSPVGLSMVTKLSPARLVGLFMGVWFFASAFGNVLVGFTVGENIAEHGYGTIFKWIGVAAIASGFVLFILSPILKRMQHGAK